MAECADGAGGTDYVVAVAAAVAGAAVAAESWSRSLALSRCVGRRVEGNRHTEATVLSATHCMVSHTSHKARARWHEM